MEVEAKPLKRPPPGNSSADSGLELERIIRSNDGCWLQPVSIYLADEDRSIAAYLIESNDPLRGNVHQSTKLFQSRHRFLEKLTLETSRITLDRSWRNVIDVFKICIFWERKLNCFDLAKENRTKTILGKASTLTVQSSFLPKILLHRVASKIQTSVKTLENFFCYLTHRGIENWAFFSS